MPISTDKYDRKVSAIESLRKALNGKTLNIEITKRSKSYSTASVFTYWNSASVYYTESMCTATGHRFDKRYLELGHGGDPANAFNNISGRIRQVLDIPDLKIVKV